MLFHYFCNVNFGVFVYLAGGCLISFHFCNNSEMELHLLTLLYSISFYSIFQKVR